MSAFSTFIAFVESELEVEFIPVAVGALAILQKNPNALGVAAAEAYVIANAPAALLTTETAVLTSAFAAINAKLQALLTAAQAKT